MHRYFQKNGFVIKFEFKREDAGSYFSNSKRSRLFK